MPSFTFSIVSKEPVKRKSNVNSHKVIESNLSAVVKSTADGLFFVTINDIDYTISNDSYSCLGKRMVYFLDVRKNRVMQYIRPDGNIENCGMYIPFIPGNTVIGYIFTNILTKKIEFHVKRVDTDVRDDIEQKRFFIEHIKTIKDSINVRLKGIRSE